MTENEALELMESLQISKDCELIKTLDFKATVIKALEDLQQYREIGTIEELKALKENNRFLDFLYGRILPNEMEKYLSMYNATDIKGNTKT